MIKQKVSIIHTAEMLQQDIWMLSKEIGENPETGYHEYFAVEKICDFLQKHGFKIQRPLAGMDTSFMARFQGGSPGSKIAFMAEYDALPDIGHGCGHNLIGAASAGAAVVLSMLPYISGEVIVLGSPAEETSGAKVALIEAGQFEGIDAALMFHPGSGNAPEISSLALDAIEVSYYGKTAHMAMSYNQGINALDAVLDLFQRIKSLKSALAKDEKIDGIIAQGGKAPNIVPDISVARFYLRALNKENLDRLRQTFLQNAREAGETVGARMEWRFYEYSYLEMKTNRSLARSFGENLKLLGIKDIQGLQTIQGSVDMGNVSHVVPAIHAYLCLGKGLSIPHTKEFAGAVQSREGEEVLALAVKALSLTGWDILTDHSLFTNMRHDFTNQG